MNTICRKCKKPIPDGSAFCNHCGAKQADPAPHPKKRGNGQGTVCRLSNGKWQAVVTLGYYTDDKGKLHRKKKTKCFAKKSEAIAALPTLKNALAHPEDISIRKLYDQYTASAEYKNLSSSARRSANAAWSRLKSIEYAGIASLTVADIEHQVKTKATSYPTANEMLALLSHLYQLAIKQEVCQYNKARNVDIPFEKPKAKKQVWTAEEVNALWADLQAHPFTAYLLIMCYSGLRYGELERIKLADIHLDQNYMVGGIKTEAGTDRQIPIHSRIKPLIAELMLSNKKKLLEIPYGKFYDLYWETIDRTGLRKLPPHTCRHYFFSRLTSEGIQGGIIAEIGGHSNYLTTVKNYVNIPLDDKLSAVNKI